MSKPKNKEVPELINFSCASSSFLKERIVDHSDSDLVNFSTYNTPTAEEVAEMYNFTIVEYLREMHRNPVQIINLRVQQLANYVKSHTKEQIAKDKELLTQYISDFLYKRVLQYEKTLVEGLNEEANLILFLGISKWIKDKGLVQTLQRELKTMARQEKHDGYCSKDAQLKVKLAFQSVLRDVLSNIEDKCIPNNKKGIILQLI